MFSCELGARRSTGCLSNKKHARRRGRRVSEFAVMNKRWHTRVQLRFCRATKPERSGTAQSQRSKIATRDAMSTQRYRRSVVHVTMPEMRLAEVVAGPECLIYGNARDIGQHAALQEGQTRVQCCAVL